VVRAPCRIRDNAAFNRESFTCVRPARPRALAPTADPLRLSTGRAYTEPSQDLTLSVAPWLGSESSTLGSFRPIAPEGTR